MQRKTWGLIVGGTAAALVLLAWAFAPRPLPVEVAQATLGPFETTIAEDARTRLAERFVVSAPLAGRLQRVTLREGDAVEAGAVVATLMPVLSPMLDERTLREQEARVGAASVGVTRARTRIEAARIALEQARIELRRTEQLAQQGFVAPAKIDAERLGAQAAQQELDAAVESERISRHELEQARAALVAVRGTSASGRGGAVFPLRAPVTGRVLKVHQQSETVLPLGAPVLEIGDIARLEIVAELLTTDALQAEPGRLVRIEQWGGAGVLRGVVRRVEPAAFTKVSALGVEEQRVKVLIDFASPREQWALLGYSYRVGVRIVTRAEARVLRVPVSAVFPLPAAAASVDAAHAVFTLRDGRAHQTPVRLGARNGEAAWIVSGLAADESVIVYPPAAVHDGARVRLR